MPQINWTWNDSNSHLQTYQLSLSETDLNAKTIIGRDQQRCNLWLPHNTVSRVHAEVSFKADWQRFYLRNLAANNPIRVDGGLLVDGEVALYEGSMVQLGQLLLQASDIAVDNSAAHAQGATSHTPTHVVSIPPVPPIPSVPPVPPVHGHAHSQTAPNSGQPSQSALPQNAQSQNAQSQNAQSQ
ncbi:MAG: FHA domain-containing protein, partial [Cyanobacteria bacterium P01_C01_bin.69]